VVVLVDHRTVWGLEYWLNTGLCGGWSTDRTKDGVVVVLVEPMAVWWLY